MEIDMKIMVTIFLLATPLDLCRAQPTLANVPISEHIEHTSSAYFPTGVTIQNEYMRRKVNFLFEVRKQCSPA